MDEEFAKQLLSTASQGQLMVWVTAQQRPEEERRRSIECLAQLHRMRRIDVFEHLHRPPGEDEWRLDYGSWCRAYREIVPLLDDDADRVVSAVVGLATGLWEPTFHDAFLDWCMRDNKRIDAVLELESRPEIPDFCFTAALIAGLRTDLASYLDVAVAYAQGNRRSRTPGIRAIGVMPVQDDAAVQSAVSALGGVLDDDHAAVRDRAGALTAALEVAQRCAGSLDGPVCSMVARATASGRAELLHACCHVLVRFAGQLQDSLLQPLLGALRGLDIDAPETRPIAESTLYSLLAHGRKEEALACLETLLRKSKMQDPLTAFASTTHHLTSASLLPVVICRWLLTGDTALCAAARHLLSSAANQKLVFDFDPGNREWPAIRTLYLARKAIGWLMPHATAPASFVVCLLRGACDDAVKELGELLIDPLLVNYPIATRAYLDAVCPILPAAAKACVEGVLARDDLYKQAIADVGFVPELQPTERRRWIENERQAEEWAKARSKAEGKSVLAQLVTRQTMLYGARAIDYVDDPGGGTRRLDNRLKTISYTADNAMGWIYDPFGLDYTLRVFRAERQPE
jgi:hypothetical protein